MCSRRALLNRSLLRMVTAAICCFALAASSHAAILTWDANGVTGGVTDGGGTWSTGNANWWNGSSTVVWPNSGTNNDEAIFGVGSGAAGIVNVSGTLRTNRVTFNAPGSGNYTIGGTTLTLNGASPTITANTSATISAPIAGTAGLNKQGAGTLTLGGVNTYTGGTNIQAGTLTVASGGSITHPSNAFVLTSSTSTLNVASGGSISVYHIQATTNAGISPTVNIAGNWTGTGTGVGTARQFVIGKWTLTGGTTNVNGMELTSSATDDPATSLFVGGNTSLTVGQGQFASLMVGGRNASTLAVSDSATLTVTGAANPLSSNANQLYVGTTFAGPAAGQRTFVQQGGTVTANGVTLGTTQAVAVNGVYYLNGGSLTTNTLNRGSNAAGTGSFYFGGGTFKSGAAFSTDANVATFINSGGATIDTSGGNLTWSGAIASGSTGNASGFTNLVGGSGYNPGQFALTFSGGGGSGAAGYAVVNQAGAVVDIVITNPGSGYTSAPTISGFGSGGASASAVIKTGSGGLTKLGAGTLTFNAANTYTGATTVNAGTLAYNVNNALATGAVIVNGSTAVLNLGAFSDTVGAVTLAGGGQINSSTGVLTSTGGYDLRSGSVGARLAGAVNAAKSTAGTVILSGANTYSGTTAVNAGTLLVNGTHTGASAYTVAYGAALGGNGTITPSGSAGVTVNGAVAPGASIGTLTFNLGSTTGGVNFSPGATFNFEVDAPGVSDLIRFNNFTLGDVVFNNNVIDFTDLGNFSPGLYTLFAFYADNGVTPINHNLTSGLVLADNAVGTLVYNGNLIQVQLTAIVPEPSTWMLCGLGAVLFGGYALRKPRTRDTFKC